MENQAPNQEEALQFARVWKRVMPEGGPILPAFPVQPVEVAKQAETVPETRPAAVEEDSLVRFLKEQIAGEQRLCREGRQLWRRTYCGDFAACADSAEKRARRLAAELYLLTGEWRLSGPGKQSAQDGGRVSLRALHGSLRALELGYLAQAERTEDGETAALLKENARRCHKDGVGLRRLLERWGPV